MMTQSTQRPTPVLKRFDIYVYRDKSYSTPTDKAQVPANATVKFYKQGATVAVAQSVGAAFVDVTVYNPGAFASWPGVPPNDQAYVNGVGDGSATIEVDWANSSSPTVLKCKRIGGSGSINLSIGDRLILASRRPALYKAPLGTVSLGTDVATDASTGRLSGYISELRFDYTITIAGEPLFGLRLCVDADGSCVMRG